MDICRFINSRDVATYLKDIGYAFSMPEAAFLVYRSRHATLEEKRAAWLELADGMPDCGMAGRLNMEPIPSFRGFLRDYAALKGRELARFLEADGCVYSGDCEGGGYGDELFGSAAGCVDYLKSTLGGDGGFDSLTITKRALDRPERASGGRLYLDHDFRVTGIDMWGEDEPDLTLSLQFEGMWFAFPTPFRRGDIVQDATDKDAHPVVLESLCTWSRKDFLANGFHEGDRAVETADRLLAAHLRNGDTTDLGWSGYDMDGGELWLGHVGHDYLGIERVTGELAPEDQWAEVVSAHLRGELRFDEAFDFLRYLEKRNECESMHASYDGTYPEEFYPDHPWRIIRQC